MAVAGTGVGGTAVAGTTLGVRALGAAGGSVAARAAVTATVGLVCWVATALIVAIVVGVFWLLLDEQPAKASAHSANRA